MQYSLFPELPAPLPKRVRLADGLTRTSLEDLSNEELAALGIYPVIEVRPTLGENEVFGQPTLELVDGVVTATYPVETIDPPVISVSPWQIRKALNAAGLRSQIESAVASSPQEVQDAWEYATEFRSDHPLVNDLSAGLGLTNVQIRSLFASAASL